MIPPEWAYKNAVFYRAWWISVVVRAIYWRIRERYTPCKCGYICGWDYPYGFVPECGCSVHDNYDLEFEPPITTRSTGIVVSKGESPPLIIEEE